MKRRTRKKTWLNTLPECFEQRMIGILLLIISAVIINLASNGHDIIDCDGTALLITIPAGIAFLLTKTSFLEY